MKIFDSLAAGDCSATRRSLNKHLPFLKEVLFELKKFDKGKEFDNDIYFYIGESLLKTDSKSAYIAFEKGAEHFNLKSLDVIARAYGNGENGYERNFIKSVDLYKKIITRSDGSPLIGKAYRNLGIIYLFHLKNKDEKVAYEFFEKGAFLNDPYCLFRIALAYRDGKCGFKQDIHKSLELFNKIEKLDYDSNKQIIAYGYLYRCIGETYSSSDYGIEDWETALKYYEKGASMNDSFCLLIIGSTFLDGEFGYKKNPEKAIAFFKKALKAGEDDKAVLSTIYANLGDAYLYDINEPKIALKYYEKGASLDNFHSLCEIAKAYGEGVGHIRNLTKSLEFYKKAEECLLLYKDNLLHCENYDVLTFYSKFGDFYRDSLNDTISAYKCYEKGASLNDPACLLRLAIAYLSGGYGYEYSFEKGNSILLKVINLKNASRKIKGTAYCILGISYFMGDRNHKQNLDKALYFFEAGQSLGDAACSLWRVETCLAKGNITETSALELIDICQKVINDEQGEIGYAYDELAKIYLKCPSLDKNHEILKNVLLKGIKSNGAECCVILFELEKKNTEKNNAGQLTWLLDTWHKINNIDIYLFLIYLVDPIYHDFSKAKKILENMEKEEVFSGFEYYAGMFSLIAERNYERATNRFLKSLKNSRFANGQYPCLFLGQIYQSEDNENKDYKLAFAYFLEGAKANDGLCAFEAGLCYKNGLGVQKDFDKAVQFFLKANKLGRKCLYEVGKIYGDKTYSGFNEEKQIFYYQKGAKNNEKKCIEKLIECYKLGNRVKKNISKLQSLIQKLETIEDEFSYDVSELDVLQKYKDILRETYVSSHYSVFKLIENYSKQEKKNAASLEEIKTNLNSAHSDIISTKNTVETINNKLDDLIEITKSLKEKYSNEFKNDEDVNETVYDKVSTEISDAALKQQITNADDLDNEIKKRIGQNSFNKLEEKSVKFLRMGMRLFKEFNDEGDNKLDYSCITVLLCKAVENELKRRLYENYLKHLETKFGEKYSEYPKILTTCKGKTIILDKADNFTLGSFKKILEAFVPENRVDVSKDTPMRDKKLLNGYLVTVLTLDASINVEPVTAQLIAGIKTIVDEYRNPSCHPAEISLALASECYDFILGNQNGFLRKTLDLFKA